MRSYLSAPRVGWGGQFVLNVEISGAQETDSEPVLPDVGDFGRYLGSSTSTSVQFANGRTRMSLTYQYRFQATQEGVFEIGPVQVTAAGNTYRTEPVSLTVSDTPAPRGGVADPGAEGGGASEEEVFLEATPARATVFENESVIVEYRIFTRVPVERYSITTLPEAAGFWIEELEQPESPDVQRVVRDGAEYLTALVRRVAYFPTSSGEKVIAPLAIEAQTRVRRPSAFGDIFGGSGLFDRRVPVAVASRPVEVEVLPVPAEGRPASFAGHVGTLGVSVEADRVEVSVGEALTLRVTLAGSGNIRALAPPPVDFPEEFEVFPPEASRNVAGGADAVEGSSTAAYVLIPRVPGSVTVPPVEVSYFDPRTRAFRTTSSEPIRIEVTGDASRAGGDAVALPTAVEPIREEIRFIDTGPPSLRPVSDPLSAKPGFWLVALLPPVALAGAAAIRRRRDRAASDLAYARERSARRVAKRRLAKARSLAAGDPRDFYAEMAGALEGFLADKLNIARAGLLRDEAAGLARRGGASEEALAELAGFLADCDVQRFAPAGSDRSPAKGVLERAARDHAQDRRGALQVRASVVVALSGLLLSGPPVRGVGGQEDLVADGNRLYQEGDFVGAAARYEAVLESGLESATLHYNLGNARYRMGETGLAALGYERALRLDPRHDDARANLALVNRRLRDRIEPLPRFWLLVALEWWRDLMPRRALALLVAVCYLVAGAAVVLHMLGRRLRGRRMLARAAWIAGAATVPLGVTLLVRETGLGSPTEAIVVAEEVRVLNAPSEDSGLTLFALHEGTKVRVDDRAGDWAEIVLADGKVGWLKLDVLAVI